MKFGFQMPNSDQARGIGTNQINIFSKLIVQKRFGRNLARLRSRIFTAIWACGNMTAPLSSFTQNDVLLYGLAGIFRLNDRINIVSEINGRLNTRGGGARFGNRERW